MRPDLKGFYSRMRERFDGQLPEPEDLPLDSRSVKDVLERDVLERVHVLSQHAARLAGVPPYALSACMPEVVMSVQGQVNACAKPLPQGEAYRIEIDLGLLHFMHLASKLVAIASDTSRSMSSSGRNRMTLDEIADGFRALRLAFRRRVLLEHRGVDLERLGNKQILFSSQLRGAMRDFVIAHEIGHVVVNESDFGQEVFEGCKDGVQTLVNRGECPLPISDRTQDTVTYWAREMAADRISAMILLMAHGRKSAPLVFAGCELVFVFYYFLAGDSDSERHPRVGTRATTFQAYSRAATDDSDLPGQLCSIVCEVVERVLEFETDA